MKKSAIREWERIGSSTVYYLYGLDNSDIFYVGQTNSKLKSRLSAHKSNAIKGTHPVNIRIRELGFKVGIMPIVEISGRSWDVSIIEYAFIEEYLLRGYNLCNVHRPIMKNGTKGIYTGTIKERVKYNLDEKGKTITNS